MIRFKYLLTTLLMGGAMHLMLHKAHAQDTTARDFYYIKVTGAVKVELHQSDRYACVISDDGARAHMDGRTLVLTGSSDRTVKVYVKDLREIDLSGTSELSTPDTLRVEQLKVSTSGASDAILLLAASKVDVSTSGTSDVRLIGRSEQLNATASGASDIKAMSLPAKIVTAHATGTADIGVFVLTHIDASASGNADVRYLGSPVTSTFDRTGMGDITSVSKAEDCGLQQGVSNNGDTTRVRLGKHRFIIIDEGDNNAYTKPSYVTPDNDGFRPTARRKMKRVWSGFELGVNGFVSPGMDFNMKPGYTALNTKYGRSWFIGLNLPEIDGHIIRNKLAVTTGFGIKWTWMELDANNMMRPDTNVLAFTPTGKALKENELNTFNLSVPVMLKFAPGTKKSAKGGFHIAAGVILNYVAATHLKTVTDGGFDTYTRYYSDFNINPFRVDATVRVGYDRLKFFANYSLTPYFDSSKAPDIRTFAAGMTLIGF